MRTTRIHPILDKHIEKNNVLKNKGKNLQNCVGRVLCCTLGWEEEIAEWKRIKGRMNMWREGNEKHSFINKKEKKQSQHRPYTEQTRISVGNLPCLHPVSNIRRHARAHTLI